MDDDELLAQVLVSNLAAQHYAIDTAMDGESGWDYAQAADYDLIVLDVNLPKLDGIRLCQRLRQNGYKKPILLLTAKGDSADKVMGLDSGADDYVVKPCTVEELSARIRALLRRPETATAPTLNWGELCLNPGTCKVTFRDREVVLSAKEYSLLELFLRQPQRVFSSSLILEHLWSFENAPGEETVRTHIKRLRRKLKAAGAEETIDTVYGMGYRLKPLIEPTPCLDSETAVPEPPPASQATAADQARQAAIDLWQQFQQPCMERLSVIDQAVLALRDGSWSEEIRAAAEHAAHKLAGSLGMFGFPEGSNLGREIEGWLQTADPKTEFTTLETLVNQLHEVMEGPPSSSDDLEWLSCLSETDTEEKQPPSLPIWITNNEELSRVLPTKISILAVDDDPTALSILQQFLPRWGINLTTLSDPRQTLQMLTKTRPDLLILDVEMPHINGIELCQLVRRDRGLDGLPILFLSARQDGETIHHLYSAGADDYIPKPFTESAVITRIFNRLERNRLLRQPSSQSSETI